MPRQGTWRACGLSPATGAQGPVQWLVALAEAQAAAQDGAQFSEAAQH